MNLAIGAIILFILFIVPSLFFNRFYFSGEFSKEYIKSSAFELFLSSIIPGFFFQILFYQLVRSITGYEVNFQILGDLIAGSPEVDNAVAIAFSRLEKDLHLIFLYNASLWLLLSMLGALCRFSVRKLQLDRKFSIFRYKNHWHYLLRGEILDFPYVQGKQSDIDFTYLDVLVCVNNTTYLYSGFLEDFQLTKEGSGLDYILISKVERRELVTGVDPNTITPVHFEGDFFQIPYSTVVNLNIHFVKIQGVAPESDTITGDAEPNVAQV